MKRKGIKVSSTVLWSLVIFIIAFALRLGLFIFVTGRVQGNFSKTYYTDSTGYILGAVNLMKHGIFCAVDTSDLYRDFFRTPGYPLFIALVYLTSNFSEKWFLITQLIISSLTCVVLFNIALKFISKPLAVIISLFLVFDIGSIINANLIMTETFFTFLTMLMLLFFVKYLKEDKKLYAALAGLLCGIATLTRPILYYFPIVVIIFIIIYYRKELKKGLAGSALFALCCLLIVGPWLARNLDIGYKGIAAVQEFNIYMYKAGWIEERVKTSDVNNITIDFNGRTERVINEVKKEGLVNNPLNRVKMYKKLGTEVLMEHPEYLLEYQIKYTLNIFTADGVHLIFDKIPAYSIGKVTGLFKKWAPKIYMIALYVVYTAALLGIVAWFITKKNKGMLLFTILLCGYITALSGELSEGSRFRVPIIPLILILSGLGMDYIKNLILNRKKVGITNE